MDQVASRSQARTIGRAIFALALGVYLLTAGGSLTTTDAVVTFDVTRNLVDHGSVAMSGNLLGNDAHRGVDGRYYAPFGIGQSIYNVPFFLAARGLEAAGFRVGKADSLEKAVVALGQTVVGAAIVWATYQLSVAVSGEVVPAVLAALTLAFGSLVWPYARFGFNQPLACLLVLLAVRDSVLGVRSQSNGRLACAGLWLAAALLTRHEAALAALPIAGWLWWGDVTRPGARTARLLIVAAGVALGAIVWLEYNLVRFGNPLDSGYLRDPTPGFGAPLLGGLLALLFSPSASLFLYSPMTVAGVVALVAPSLWRDRRLALLLASLVVAFALLYASLGNWLGGRSYGSRYLVLVLPYCATGLAVLFSRLQAPNRTRLFAAVLGIGVLVQLPGVLVDYAKVSQQAASVESFTQAERQWSWHASPLALNARASLPALADNAAYVIGARTPPPARASQGDADRTFSQQFSFSLDFWWLYLFYLGAVGRAVPLAMLAVAALFVAVMSRRLAHLVSEVPFHG